MKLENEARTMLRRWTNKSTGIDNMGFIATYRDEDDASLTDEWGKTIEELRSMAAKQYATSFRVMVMGRSEHEGRPVMRLEAWEKSTGASVALIQPFRRGIFGNYPRPSGAPLNVGTPPHLDGV